MKHYVNMVQEEFAARDKATTFVSHQREVIAGYRQRIDHRESGAVSFQA